MCRFRVIVVIVIRVRCANPLRGNFPIASFWSRVTLRQREAALKHYTARFQNCSFGIRVTLLAYPESVHMVC